MQKIIDSKLICSILARLAVYFEEHKKRKGSAMRVAVITKNRYLGQKIFLTLHESAEISVIESATDGFDLYILDIDTVAPTALMGRTVTVSRDKDCDLDLPCSFEALRALLSSDTKTSPLLILKERRAYLRGEEIRLTELEAALLGRLISAGGEFVSREDILRDVWRGGADAGIINVYVHYLREKLERGEKIILSSRLSGYRIDEKFLK